MTNNNEREETLLQRIMSMVCAAALILTVVLAILMIGFKIIDMTSGYEKIASNIEIDSITVNDHELTNIHYENYTDADNCTIAYYLNGVEIRVDLVDGHVVDIEDDIRRFAFAIGEESY